jgi:hypothetical protein
MRYDQLSIDTEVALRERDSHLSVRADPAANAYLFFQAMQWLDASVLSLLWFVALTWCDAHLLL